MDLGILEFACVAYLVATVVLGYQVLRPREHRQLVQTHPSTYGRPHTAETIGKGLSASASMGSLLQWDTDGDGNIVGRATDRTRNWRRLREREATSADELRRSVVVVRRTWRSSGRPSARSGTR